MVAGNCADNDAPGQWRFWRSRDRAWRWRQISVRGVSRVSRAAFLTLADCMANAIYHGYLPPSQADGAEAA